MIKTAMTLGQENLNNLNFFLSQPWLCEYAGNKDGFKDASLTFLRQLLKDVEQILVDKWADSPIADYKISFNPCRPGNAGDPSLYFVTSWNMGVALHISERLAISGLKLKCSEIKTMNDRPVSPSWLSVRASYESIVNAVVRMVTVVSTPNITALTKNKRQQRMCTYVESNIRQNHYALCPAA